MDNYFAGDTPQAIAEFYRITLEEAQAATRYIDEHMAELMPHYRKMLARDRQGDPPEVRARYPQAHARLMALKEKLERRKAQGDGDARAAG
jgi:hypothetical protein